MRMGRSNVRLCARVYVLIRVSASANPTHVVVRCPYSRTHKVCTHVNETKEANRLAHVFTKHNNINIMRVLANAPQRLPQRAHVRLCAHVHRLARVFVHMHVPCAGAYLSHFSTCVHVRLLPVHAELRLRASGGAHARARA
jgi:hypothetical protein